jgi:PAS domain S-box-containing protein
MLNGWLFISAGAVLVAALFCVWQYYRFHRAAADLQKKTADDIGRRGAETNRQLYELSILKELGDRIGYSLNVQKIVDIIADSLPQFIEYSTVSSMLVKGGHITFKIHLERSVSRAFIDDVKDRMIKSLSALLGQEFQSGQIEEIVSGAISLESVETPVRSFFNIPLIIREKVVGVFTVAHTVAGLYKEEEMTILYKIVQQASTAVTRLEEVVEAEELKLQAMVEDIAEGVVVVDVFGTITFANKPVADLFGYTVPEMLGKPFLEVLLMQDEKGIPTPVAERPFTLAMRSGTRTFATAYYTRKDRTVFPVSITVAPVMVTGAITGAVATFRDVTREREIDRAKTEFVSLASHQLRTPLSAIGWYSEMLMAGDAGPMTDDQKSYLKEIHDGNTRMVDLVNSLLNVSRLELGTFAIEPQVTDIIAIVESVLAELAPQITEKKQHLEKKFASNIPPISVDVKLFRMIIQNLASNAVKYTSEDGIIGVAVEKKDVDLAITVRDSGYGIPKNQQDKIFSKLFRADNIRKFETEGTGLGLYIVKSILDQSGGSIRFESEEGKGSSFFVTIPLSGMHAKEGARKLS